GCRGGGPGGRPCAAEPRPGFPEPSDPQSMRTAKIKVLGLESPLLISPGTPVAVRGDITRFERDEDGTIHLDKPLEPGASYTVTAWAPDPPPADLRAHSRRYPPALAPYTQLALSADASLESISAPVHVGVPLWGTGRDRRATVR